MTKKDLAIRIANETGMVQADVLGIIQKTLDYITDELATNGRVEFREFGVFDVRTCKQRVGRNPAKPEIPVIIPAHKVVRFRAGKRMRELIENI